MSNPYTKWGLLHIAFVVLVVLALISVGKPYYNQMLRALTGQTSPAQVEKVERADPTDDDLRPGRRRISDPNK